MQGRGTGGSGHGGDGSWNGGGRGWELQGFAGRGKNVKWHFRHPPPPHVYIGPFVAAEKSPCQIFAILSEFGLMDFLKSQKFKLINNII